MLIDFVCFFFFFNATTQAQQVHTEIQTKLIDKIHPMAIHQHSAFTNQQQTKQIENYVYMWASRYVRFARMKRSVQWQFYEQIKRN